MKDEGFASLFEERAKRCKITFSEPVRSPARYSNSRRIDREELHHEFVNRVPVTASCTLLIEPIDEKHLALQHRGRRVQKCARLDKPCLPGSGSFLKQMSFAGTRISEQNDVSLTGKVRELVRRCILGGVGRSVCLTYSSGHIK